MPKYDCIDAVYVRFGRHPNHQETSTQLNIAYSGEIDPAVFLDSPKDFILDSVVEDIRRTIKEELIIPHASTTADHHDIERALLRCPIKFSVTEAGTTDRLTKTSLDRAVLRQEKKSPDVSIWLLILTDRLHWPVDGTADFLDWSGCQDTRYTVVGAGATAPPPSATAFVTAMMTALGSTTPPAPPVGGAPPTGTAGTGPSPYLFNHRALPTDVEEAYLRRKSGRVLTKTLLTGNFAGGNRYYEDSTERIILHDGSLFVLSPTGPNHKELLRNSVVCKDDSHQGVRSWYETLMRHCFTHGFYVHPLWCFRKAKGGSWGFTCGPDADDDLPSRMEVLTQESTDTIFKLLQKPGMFPSGSTCIEVIQQCRGDGYRALKQVLFHSHPVFHQQPATLIPSYPSQHKSQTLMKYHELFNDFLQLRAFISDIDSSLDNDSEMDIFINRAQHGVWLNSVTRKDRQEADAADRYNSGQIVETLSGFLTLPDSPSRVATPAPVARSTTAVLPRHTNAPPQRTSGLQAPRP